MKRCWTHWSLRCLQSGTKEPSLNFKSRRLIGCLSFPDFIEARGMTDFKAHRLRLCPKTFTDVYSIITINDHAASSLSSDLSV